jgi:uncharacterized protein YjbJ (UPF0337 family)
MTSLSEIQGKWKQQVGAAKVVWSRLTGDELLRSEGHVQALAGRLQAHCAIGLDDANKRLKKFARKHGL